MRAVLALPLLLLAACDLPRDTEGTSERVVSVPGRQGDLRMGLVSGSSPRPDALVASIGIETRARVLIEEGASETLLARLEAGELDVVVGAFDARSPWNARVTFSKPLTRKGVVETKAAVRSGEHRWAMLVDRAVERAPGIDLTRPHVGFIEPDGPTEAAR